MEIIDYCYVDDILSCRPSMAPKTLVSFHGCTIARIHGSMTTRILFVLVWLTMGAGRSH